MNPTRYAFTEVCPNAMSAARLDLNVLTLRSCYAPVLLEQITLVMVDFIVAGKYPSSSRTVLFTNLGYPVLDRKSTRLNSSHSGESRMPSSA